MSSIEIRVPDDLLPRVLAAFSKQYPDRSVEEVLAQIIKDIVRNAEEPEAIDAARKAWNERFERELSGIA